MEEATYGMTAQAIRPDEADKALLVKFLMLPVMNHEKSEEAGRPIYEDREFIDIRVPGERNTALIRKARERDKQRFPEHYRAFKSRIESPTIGTPLSEWPGISRSDVENLAYQNIKTVEQLASAADSAGNAILGFYRLRDNAKIWLKESSSKASVEQMESLIQTNEKLMARLAALEARLSEEETEESSQEEEEVSEEEVEVKSKRRK